mgnify:CR=1 FL=1|tara:strand:- start:1089 stop:1532 length:444 start_codon:yes stop_codon:yes gene_type:complete
MATAGIINGTDFGVYQGTTLVAYATSGSISINHSTRDISSKESLGWKEQMEGQRDWEVSVEGLVAFLAAGGGAVGGKTIDELLDDYMLGSAGRGSLTVMFSTEVTGDFKWSGTAWITSVSIDSPNEDNTTYSVSFSGTGALTQAAVS